MRKQGPLIIGHRGAAGHAPENTQASIRAAFDLNADWIEIDLRMCKDALIVVHDDTLDRTTNGNGPAANLNYAEIWPLDAGQGESIPTLETVLGLLPESAGINIELKEPQTLAPLVECLTRRDECAKRSVLVSSFDWALLDNLRVRMPAIDLAPLTKRRFTDAMTAANSLNAYAINASHKHLSRKHVTAAHAQQRRVFAYTANTPKEIAQMLDIGVDGIISDYPDRVRTTINAHANRHR
ncbi:MAG: glycerophosphodiester phosphodiesterase family protein [Kiritimatiellae bacterium]|nr:glycerophosphodiester phosphodiesterase family protein [Kiritimatiellia bacterium]